VELLRDLRIVEDSQPYVETVRNVLPLARKHELSAYDAAYVDVALRYAVPLATLDPALRKAVQAAGGRVLKV
jgi:predicted nucleic acid-binding protein